MLAASPKQLRQVGTSLARAENLDARVRSLDEKVARAQVGMQSKAKNVEESLERLNDDLHALSVNNKILSERSSKELKLLESNVTYDINLLRQMRRDSMSMLDSAATQLQEQLRAQFEARRDKSDWIESATERVGRQIADFADALETECDERERKSHKVARAIDVAIDGLHETLAAETEEREFKETKLVEALESICAKMQSDMDEERRLREESEEQLLQLLEETCTRVETAVEHAKARRARLMGS